MASTKRAVSGSHAKLPWLNAMPKWAVALRRAAANKAKVPSRANSANIEVTEEIAVTGATGATGGIGVAVTAVEAIEVVAVTIAVVVIVADAVAVNAAGVVVSAVAAAEIVVVTIAVVTEAVTASGKANKSAGFADRHLPGVRSKASGGFWQGAPIGNRLPNLVKTTSPLSLTPCFSKALPAPPNP